MPSRIPPIARIRLARSPLRLLLVPLVLLLAGVAMAAGAWIGPLAAPEPAWIALGAGGAVLGLIGLVMALRLVTPGSERMRPSPVARTDVMNPSR